MFEDTKGRKSETVTQRKTDKPMTKRKKTKGQTIYTTLHRKLKIEQNEPH